MKRKLFELKNSRTQQLEAAEKALTAGDGAAYDAAMGEVGKLNGEIDKRLLDCIGSVVKSVKKNLDRLCRQCTDNLILTPRILMLERVIGHAKLCGKVLILYP